MSKKKAPKPPKPAAKPPAKPTTLSEDFFNALVGRGLRPFSVWFGAIFLPLLLLLCWGTGNRSSTVGLCVAVWLWTVPLDKIAWFLLGLGNVRECLADVLPHAGGLVPYLPEMLWVILPNLWAMLPAFGPLAPYLKFLIQRPAFLAKALPLMAPRIELMLQYNMIELLGANFERMQDIHYEKLEMILPDLMRDLPLLAPDFHVIAPFIVEIAERADVLFPVVQLLLPHIDECEPHLWWLVPFADVPGFQDFLVYLDVLVSSIDEFAIYGPELLPYIPKIRAQIPILVENLDSLLPLMGDAVDHMDPLVYWLSAYMPLANRLGLLNKPTLLHLSLPALGLLPNVPERHRTFVTPKEHILDPVQGFALPLVRLCKHSRVHYYVLAHDGKYLGEVRYSTLLKLHEGVVQPRLASTTPFPPKGRRPDVEVRRQELETYLVRVLNDRSITSSQDFKLLLQTSFPEALQQELAKLL